MTNLTRLSRLPVLVLAALPLVAACEEEAEPALVPPTASFAVSPGTVGNDAVTTIETSDDQGVVDVRLFFDNLQVAHRELAPYVMTWSTVGLAEGEHTLKAVVTDLEGLDTSVQATVIVDHTGPSMDCPVNAPGAVMSCELSDPVGVGSLELELEQFIDGEGLDTARALCGPETLFQLTGCGSGTLRITGRDRVGNGTLDVRTVELGRPDGGACLPFERLFVHCL